MRALSADLLAQIFGQNSDDPFLTLVTLSHTSFSTIRLVDNTEDVVSNSDTFQAFPFKITLPLDDGESSREVKLIVDNVNLELIEELRSVTDPIDVKIEMILASNPDFVEMSFDELKLRKITINSQRISGTMVLDDFLNTGMTSERYTPTFYPGLFG